MLKFYADLNPYYPSRGEKRYAVMYRSEDGRIHRAPGVGSFAARKSAENNAAKLQAKENEANQ